jgi:hypothetical protein
VRGQTLEGVGCPPSVGATRRVAPTSLWGEEYTPLEGEPPGEPKNKTLSPTGGEGTGEGAHHWRASLPASR